jgi:hypothetical protein
MEGLTIRKKVMPRVTQGTNWFDDIIGYVFLAVLAVIAIPFLLVAWIFVIVADLFDRRKPKVPAEANQLKISTPLFTLHYEYIRAGAISEAAEEYFDDELLIRYRTEPGISFFEGYFSDFKIERASGLFTQKVNFNTALTEVVSMPLYFFNYATREAVEIHDFKEYSLDTKGGPNNFKIIASSLEDDGEDLEIEIFFSSTVP